MAWSGRWRANNLELALWVEYTYQDSQYLSQRLVELVVACPNQFKEKIIL